MMVNSPDSDCKRPLENGLNSINEENGNAGENEPCLPMKNKSKSVESINKKDLTDSTVKLKDDMEKVTFTDPQLKNSVNSNQKRNRFRKLKISTPKTTVFEKKLQEKTGLSRLGLLVAGLVLLFFVILLVTVVLMTILWPRIPHALQFPVCRRAACLRASSEILPKMNFDVQPCENFRNFSCGSWMKTEQIPKSRGEWGLEQKLIYDYRDQIRKLLATSPYPTKSTSLAWKLHTLYKSCMSMDNIESDDVRPLQKIFSKFGGWLPVRNFSPHAWDTKRVMEKLHADYGVDVFFKISVVADARDGQSDIIQISQAPLGLPDRSYYTQSDSSPVIEAYKRLLRDAAVEIGATDRHAKVFSDAIFSFEKRIVETMPEKISVDPLQEYNKISLDKVKVIASSIPILEILLAKFPRVQINENTKLVVPSEEYLGNISYLISSTDHSTLNNYMIWRLVVKYLPYLSEKFRHPYNMFRKDLYGEVEPTERWEFCVSTLQKFMSFGLSAMIQRKSHSFHQDYKVVNDMFEEIVRSVKRNIASSDLDQHLREHLLDKINSLGLKVGFADNMVHDTYLDTFYTELIITPTDFFQNIMSGEAFLQDFDKRRLKAPASEYRWISTMSSPHLDVQYLVSRNEVLVPVARLMSPFFDPEYPLPLLYGTLGTALAQAILSSLSPSNLHFAGDGTLLSPDHPALPPAMLASQSPFQCIHAWLARHSTTHQLRNTTTLEAMLAVAGIRQAYQALHSALSTYPHIHQPGFEYYENEAIFFVTYAQSLCILKTPQQKAMEYMLGTRLDDSLLLDAVLAQSKEFTTAFSCQPSTKHFCEQACEDLIKPNMTSESDDSSFFSKLFG
ncbi:endothelin-converting enzyme 2 isoform X4 [Nilaparvata lugens]|uniref:endothelin-converting enzyme 2 isoform X4 n=1 Tax=Nilaparvata lugens TaxID=108931 RepID=UPI00193CDFF3|nr:endothelin-converting enzyme 2 isoform X4 [Nilaparvata lugens]